MAEKFRRRVHAHESLCAGSVQTEEAEQASSTYSWEDMISQVAFVQRTLTSEKGPGEYSYNINADELFHVDLERKDIVWRLPQFRDLSTYPAESALRNIAVLRSNLDILMRRSNNTPVENGTTGPLNPTGAGP
ncbi:UNVERIFIED_CONTAM: hypothetical protein K2H54_066424 [Gekko kuhli]